MRQSLNRFYLIVKNNGLFSSLCVIILCLFLVLIYDGDQQQKGFWPHEVISALLGAATVAVITLLLLKSQERSNNLVEQKKKVFENRLKVYESFLRTLRRVVVENKVDEQSEKILQFEIAIIGMHTESKDMLIVSKNLKAILQKIRISEHADGSIWNELMIIVNVLHNSLYSDESRAMDSDMRKALRNFNGLCVDDSYQVLEFVECLLSDYKFDSFIANRCLFYNIRVKKQMRVNEKEKIPKRIYVSLRIDKCNTNGTFGGIVALYCEKNHEDLIENIIEKPKYWKGPKIPLYNESDIDSNKLYSQGIRNIELGVNVINKAQVYSFDGMEKMHLQSAICDLITFMYPLWADEGVAFLRRDKDGKLKREFPWEKIN